MVVESIEGYFSLTMRVSSRTANFPELTEFFYVLGQLLVQEYFAATLICAIVVHALNKLFRQKAHIFTHRFSAGWAV